MKEGETLREMSEMHYGQKYLDLSSSETHDGSYGLKIVKNTYK